jgi:hypothetical protein
VLDTQGGSGSGSGSALVIFPPHSLPSGNAAAVRVLQVLFCQHSCNRLRVECRCSVDR